MSTPPETGRSGVPDHALLQSVRIIVHARRRVKSKTASSPRVPSPDAPTRGLLRSAPQAACPQDRPRLPASRRSVKGIGAAQPVGASGRSTSLRSPVASGAEGPQVGGEKAEPSGRDPLSPQVCSW